jgi:hypothetical protein
VSLDGLTDTLRSTLRLIGADYPLQMLAGIAGGFILDGAMEVTAAGAQPGTWLRAIADLGPLYGMALGVLVAVLIIRLSGNRLDEQTERDLDLIARIIERGGLGEIERRMAWRAVLAKGVEAFRPGGERQLDARRLAEEAVRETRE